MTFWNKSSTGLFPQSGGYISIQCTVAPRLSKSWVTEVWVETSQLSLGTKFLLPSDLQTQNQPYCWVTLQNSSYKVLKESIQHLLRLKSLTVARLHIYLKPKTSLCFCLLCGQWFALSSWSSSHLPSAWFIGLYDYSGLEATFFCLHFTVCVIKRQLTGVLHFTIGQVVRSGGTHTKPSCLPLRYLYLTKYILTWNPESFPSLTAFSRYESPGKLACLFL